MRTMHLAAITFAAWAGTAEPAAVTIYKYVDAQGHVTYTNQVPRGEARYTTLEIETDTPAVAPAEVLQPPVRPAKGKARAAKADAHRPRAAPMRYAAWSAALSVASLDASRRGGRVLPVVRLRPGDATPEPSLDLRLDSRLGGVALMP